VLRPDSILVPCLTGLAPSGTAKQALAIVSMQKTIGTLHPVTAPCQQKNERSFSLMN